MTRRELPSDLDVDALLERGREIPRVPEAVRARVLHRARMVAAKPRLLELEPDHAVRARPSMLAIAAAAALVAGIAGAVVAARLHSAPAPAPDASAPTPPPLRETKAEPGISVAEVPSEPSLLPSAPSAPLEPAPRTVAQPAAQESYAAELQLLRRAQSAYAARDFSGALARLSEHSKRFPTGRLMEEREALRVRSLASAGNMDQARRAFAAFATRFPRSVLLPRLRQAVQIDPE